MCRQLSIRNSRCRKSSNITFTLHIGFTPRVRLLSDLATECHRLEVAKSLSNQARGVQPACTMTTQNSKNQVDKQHCPEVKVDNLVINLKLSNLIGQFQLVICYITLYYFTLHYIAGSKEEGMSTVKKVRRSDIRHSEPLGMRRPDITPRNLSRTTSHLLPHPVRQPTTAGVSPLQPV